MINEVGIEFTNYYIWNNIDQYRDLYEKHI